MEGGWSRREAALGALALGLAAPRAWGRPQAAAALSAPAPIAAPPASPEPPQTLDDLVTLDMAQDGSGRMTVPVTVNGRGPFRFMVDTGADRSVLSEELAAMLALPAAGVVRVNGIAGALLAPRAQVARLEVGGRRLDGAPLALLPRRFMGALGYVGLDALRDQRLEIDFARSRMTVRRSRGWGSEPGEIVVFGKARFGQLMLVDSSVRSKSIYVILDSGAQNTLGNPALRAFLEARRAAAGGIEPPLVELASVTGQTATGVDAEVTDLILGGVLMRRVPVVYADLHTFRMFKLESQPALMLGMDTLRNFAAVSVDFGRREVGFRLNDAVAAPRAA